MGARLLPGEQVEIQLRPHPMSYFPRYLIAVLYSVAALGVWLFFQTEWWGREARTDCIPKFWHCVQSSQTAAWFMLAGAVLLYTGVIALFMRKWNPVVEGGVIVGLAVASSGAADYQNAIPLALAFAGPLLLFWHEMDRRSQRYQFTNLRIIYRDGVMGMRHHDIRYEAVYDMDTRQGLLGKWFNFGSIIPVVVSTADPSAPVYKKAQRPKGKEEGESAKDKQAERAMRMTREIDHTLASLLSDPNRMMGLAPFGKVHHLLDVLVQNMTTSAYLRQREQLESKRKKALDAVKRAKRQAPMVEAEIAK